MSKLSRRIAVSTLALAGVIAIAPSASADALSQPPAPAANQTQLTGAWLNTISPYGEENIVCNVDVKDIESHRSCWQQREDGQWQELETVAIASVPGHTGSVFGYDIYPVWEDPTSLNDTLPISFS